jgi:hypothetical protein
MSVLTKVNCVKVKTGQKNALIDEQIYDILKNTVNDDTLLKKLFSKFDGFSLSITSTDDVSPPKSRSKEDIFKKERNELIHKFNKVLDLSEHGGILVIENLTEEQEKQINDLASEVQKFFVCSNWSCFNEYSDKLKRPALSLIKTFYRKSNFDVCQSVSYKKIKGVTTKITNLIIIKK